MLSPYYSKICFVFRIPESVLLIIVGAISGAIINTIDACEIQVKKIIVGTHST